MGSYAYDSDREDMGGGLIVRRHTNATPPGIGGYNAMLVRYLYG